MKVSSEILAQGFGPERQAQTAFLEVLPVDDDSMEPTLRRGDAVVVDCRKVGYVQDAVYAVRHDGTLKVKRLQGVGHGVIMAYSDNPCYETIAIHPGESPEQFSIYGRVVWVGRRL